MNETTMIPLAVVMGLGLAASCGFRVFVPPLLLGIALKFHLVPDHFVNENFAHYLSSNLVLLALILATLFETLASKIPGVDHALDAVNAPLSMLAGTILTSNMLTQIDDPVIRYALGLIAGGGTAGLVHAGNSALRLLSTKATFGFLNPFLSTIQSFISWSLSTLAILFPLIAIAIIAAVFLFAMWLFNKVFRSKPETQIQK